MNNDLRATLAAQKTRENLAALAAGVTDSSLEDAYVGADDIKSCRFHFHHPPMGVNLGKLDFFSDLSDEEKSFLRKAGSSLTFGFFVDASKKIKSIDSSIRESLARKSIGGSNLIERKSFYEDFLPDLRKKELELDELKAQMARDYEEEIAAFEDNVMSVVKKVCPSRVASAERAISSITGRTADSFLNQICFELETAWDLGGIGEEQKDSEELKELLDRARKAHAERGINAMFAGMLKELWDATASYVAGIQSAPDTLDGYSTTRSTLRKKVEKVERENLGFPEIASFTDSLKELSGELVKDIAEADAFEIMSCLLGRGLEVGTSFRFLKGLPEWCNREDLLANYSAS